MAQPDDLDLLLPITEFDSNSLDGKIPAVPPRIVRTVSIMNENSDQPASPQHVHNWPRYYCAHCGYLFTYYGIGSGTIRCPKCQRFNAVGKQTGNQGQQGFVYWLFRILFIAAGVVLSRETGDIDYIAVCGWTFVAGVVFIILHYCYYHLPTLITGYKQAQPYCV